MIGIVGQSILLGVDGAIPTMANVLPIQEVTLRNADFSYLHVTKNLLNSLPTSIPMSWVSSTIMDATFNNLNAGNLDFLSDNINKLIVQRSRTDSGDGSWVTLFEIPIENQSELSFTVNDFTNISGATYVYKIVPILNQSGVEVEGVGSISEEVESLFDGVFICTSDDFIKLYAGVKYNDMQAVQITGVHQTLNNKYPIIVSNSKVGYHTGGLSGTILNKDYGEIDAESGTRIQLDSKKIVQRRKEVEDFINSKHPKILKDSDGNAWLVIFTDNINYSFFNDWGKSLGDMSMSWTEIGNPEDERDLRRTGFVGGVNA